MWMLFELRSVVLDILPWHDLSRRGSCVRFTVRESGSAFFHCGRGDSVCVFS